MSFSEVLDTNGKICTKYIDSSKIYLDIENVNFLQTNLNLLQSEIAEIIDRQQYAEFYAVMPAENATAVAPGDSVDFPNNGSFFGGIVRSGTSAFEFVLPVVGSYEVYFSVSVAEAGQLGVLLNSALVPSSIVGKDGLDSQLIGRCVVDTTVANSILSIVNPISNSTSLTLTPNAGGTEAVTATLLIKRLK